MIQNKTWKNSKIAFLIKLSNQNLVAMQIWYESKQFYVSAPSQVKVLHVVFIMSLGIKLWSEISL